MAALLIEARGAASAARCAGRAALDAAILEDLVPRCRALAAGGLATNIYRRPPPPLAGLADFALVQSYLSTAAK